MVKGGLFVLEANEMQSGSGETLEGEEVAVESEEEEEEEEAEAPVRGKMARRLEHAGFDPSCDCWCCNTDLRRWCMILSFFRLAVLCGLEVCFYVSFFPTHKHQGKSERRVENQMPHNKSGLVDVKEPKMKSFVGRGLHPHLPEPHTRTFLQLPQKVVAQHIEQLEPIHFYLHMLGLALVSIVASVVLFAGAKAKKPLLLSFVPVLMLVKIAGLIWFMMLEDDAYFTAAYTLAIIFDIFVAICALSLIRHIKNGYYNSLETPLHSDTHIQERNPEERLPNHRFITTHNHVTSHRHINARTQVTLL